MLLLATGACNWLCAAVRAWRYGGALLTDLTVTRHTYGLIDAGDPIYRTIGPYRWF